MYDQILKKMFSIYEVVKDRKKAYIDSFDDLEEAKEYIRQNDNKGKMVIIPSYEP